MTNGALNSDERLSQLVAVGEQQQRNIAAMVEGINGLSQGMSEFRGSFSELREITRQQAETSVNQQRDIAAMVEGINELSQGMSELRGSLSDLKEITRQQAETSVNQQETIRQLANISAQQARSVSELSRFVRDSLESSRQAAQAAQSAAILAQDNQNAIRDLIEELRQGRQEH